MTLSKVQSIYTGYCTSLTKGLDATSNFINIVSFWLIVRTQELLTNSIKISSESSKLLFSKSCFKLELLLKSQVENQRFDVNPCILEYNPMNSLYLMMNPAPTHSVKVPNRSTQDNKLIFQDNPKQKQALHPWNQIKANQHT